MVSIVWIFPIFHSSSLHYKSLIFTVSCQMSKPPTAIAISFSVYIYYIEISSYSFSSASLLLQGVSDHYCICSFHLFYWSRSCWYLLYFLPSQPHLRWRYLEVFLITSYFSLSLSLISVLSSFLQSFFFPLVFPSVFV